MIRRSTEGGFLRLDLHIVAPADQLFGDRLGEVLLHVDLLAADPLPTGHPGHPGVHQEVHRVGDHLRWPWGCIKPPMTPEGLPPCRPWSGARDDGVVGLLPGPGS